MNSRNDPLKLKNALRNHPSALNPLLPYTLKP